MTVISLPRPTRFFKSKVVMDHLDQVDLEDLRRSGLTDATIREAKFRTENDAAEISRILNWDKPATQLNGGLIIPFLYVDGHWNGFARVKPHCPRTDGKGKAFKYEQPRGVPSHALFTPLTVAYASDPSIDIVILEGEKKAWRTHQAGFACIGLCGVWAWQKPKSEPRALIEELSSIDWAGRRVPICFDTDENRNPNVNHARAELARVLTDLGAKVYLIDFPLVREGK